MPEGGAAAEAKLFEKVTARKEPQQRRKSTGAKTAGGAARSAAKTAAKKEDPKTAGRKKREGGAGKERRVQDRGGNEKTRAEQLPVPPSGDKKTSAKPSIKVTFLGGLNEIGKNITLFECGKDMFLLDCGMTFPDGDMLGVDLVIPDFSYVERNKERIKGLVITHGHEDHIGAIPYLLKTL